MKRLTVEIESELYHWVLKQARESGYAPNDMASALFTKAVLSTIEYDAGVACEEIDATQGQAFTVGNESNE